MIKDIIELLKVTDVTKDNEILAIAKGKYKAPQNWKEIKQSIKLN